MLTTENQKSTHYQSVLNKGEVEERLISHNHSGEFNRLNSEELTELLVRGTIMCSDTNTELKFDKAFYSHQDAEEYMKKMSEKYPISEIVMEKHTSQQLLIYI